MLQLQQAIGEQSMKQLNSWQSVMRREREQRAGQQRRVSGVLWLSARNPTESMAKPMQLRQCEQVHAATAEARLKGLGRKIISWR